MASCDIDAVAESYISLGEALAGIREEPSGSEPPIVQAFILECGGPINVSIGEVLGREARQVMVETLSERGFIAVCTPNASPDSLAHVLVFAGLLAAAESRGDPSASTVRLRILDEILSPIIERLSGGEYCMGLLAEAIRAILDMDLECLGLKGTSS